MAYDKSLPNPYNPSGKTVKAKAPSKKTNQTPIPDNRLFQPGEVSPAKAARNRTISTIHNLPRNEWHDHPDQEK